MIDFSTAWGAVPEVTDRQLREAFASIVELTRADAFYVEAAKRHIDLLDRGAPLFIRTASDVLSEQRSRVLEILSPDTRWTTRDGQPIPATYRFHLARYLLRATPVLWEDDVRQACHKLTLPPTISLSDLVLAPASQFWTWTADLCFDESGYGLVGITLVYERDMLCVFAIGSPSVKSEQRYLDVEILNANSVYPQHYECFPVRCASLGPLLKMLIFLASPYVPRETCRVPRPEARRAGKKPSDYPDVTFLSLRKIISQSGDGEGSLGTSREWQHRWLVSGHIRNQWYPATRTHKAIYVPPYIKGPDHKPFLQHARRVIR